LINGIQTEWEANGGGKLKVKDLQSQDSKVVLALYYVFTGKPYSIILKTMESSSVTPPAFLNMRGWHWRTTMNTAPPNSQGSVAANVEYP
jgi:hypothetical protein